ncbi:MAG: hypothetical protein ACK550_11045 [Synechococcaceae cyanobacterium]|jgi:hypothetical protein
MTMIFRPPPAAQGSARVLVFPLLALAASLALWNSPTTARAASALLEQVRTNPQLARGYCARFSQLNAEGVSATSKRSIDEVAAKQGLSPVDAEVLITYVIGLYCPDTR